MEEQEAGAVEVGNNLSCSLHHPDKHRMVQGGSASQ